MMRVEFVAKSATRKNLKSGKFDAEEVFISIPNMDKDITMSRNFDSHFVLTEQRIEGLEVFETNEEFSGLEKLFFQLPEDIITYLCEYIQKHQNIKIVLYSSSGFFDKMIKATTSEELQEPALYISNSRKKVMHALICEDKSILIFAISKN